MCWLLKYVGFGLLLPVIFTAVGQRFINVRQIDTDDGLSQNSVNQVVRSQDGFVWLATQDGLNRYTGYGFDVFRRAVSDSMSISDNFIISLVEDRFGRLWLATRDGLNVFDPRAGRSHTVFLNKSLYHQPSLLNHIKDHVYFISMYETDGIFLYSIPDSLSLTRSSYSVREVADLEIPLDDRFAGYFNLNNRLAVLNRDSLLLPDQKISLKRNIDPAFPSYNQNNDFLLLDSILLFTSNQNLLKLDLRTMMLQKIETTLSIQCIEPIKDEIWVGTADGIRILDDQFIPSERVDSYDYDLKNVVIHDLSYHRDGLLWIGTANLGVFIHDTRLDRFEYLNHRTLGVQMNDHVWSMHLLPKKTILGTNSGLVIVSGERRELFLPNYRISAVLQDRQGNIWAGTRDAGLFLMPDGANAFEPFGITKFSQSEEVSRIIQRSDHSIWVGTYGGIYSFPPIVDGKLPEHHAYQFIPMFVMSAWEDSRDNLWVGHNNGLSYLSSKLQWVHIPFKRGDSRSVNFNFVSGFAEDPEGQIYISTYGGGISRLESDSTFTHFTEEGGLPNNVVHGIVYARDSALWMTTNAGISRFDLRTESFKTFTKSSGLLSNNFSISALEIAFDQRIIAGTVDGMLRFNPLDFQHLDIRPRFARMGVKLNHKRVEMEESIWILDPSVRTFSVDFQLLHYRNPGDVRYSYRMVPFDEQWNHGASTLRSVTYTTLPEGDFELEIRAASAFNLFHPVIYRQPVRVLPPVWKTWWFILITVVLSLSVVGWVVFYFSRRKLKGKLLEYEARDKVQSERERLSRDLHDSVGSHYAYMISRLEFLNLAWERSDTGQTRSSLRQLEHFARSGMQMLRATIWALNEKDVDLRVFWNKVRDYLNLVLVPEEVQYEFVHSGAVDRIDTHIALNCFRIVQEAISNSLRHGQATGIRVSMEFPAVNNFEISIVDNGKGCDSAEVISNSEHYGLKNIQYRSEELGAEMQFTSDERGSALIISRKSPK